MRPFGARLIARAGATVAMIACALGLSAGAALGAAPGTILATFPFAAAHGYGNAITWGPDGALWFTRSDTNSIDRMSTSGQLTEYPLPNVASVPEGITVGPDGALWFTERGDPSCPITPCPPMQGTEAVGRIGRITTQGQITEYPTPPDFHHVPGASSDAEPTGIVTGPDGNLWFTEQLDGGIGVITPSGAIKAIFPLPPNANTATTGAAGIVVGPDSSLWFSDNNGEHIGRITTQGQISELPVDNVLSGAITSGGDSRLWAVAVGDSFASLSLDATTVTGSLSEYPQPGGVANGEQTFAATTAPDGAVWVGGFVGADSPTYGVYRVSPDGASTFYALPSFPDWPPIVSGLTIDPDGNLWAVTQNGLIVEIATGDSSSTGPTGGGPGGTKPKKGGTPPGGSTHQTPGLPCAGQHGVQLQRCQAQQTYTHQLASCRHKHGKAATACRRQANTAHRRALALINCAQVKNPHKRAACTAKARKTK